MACDQDVVAAIVKKHLEAMAREAYENDLCHGCITVEAISALYYTALVAARRNNESGAAASMVQEALQIGMLSFMMAPDPENPSDGGSDHKKGIH